MSLRNIDYSDRELLHIIARCEIDGWATSEDIAETLGITSSNGRSPAGRVATRLAWMARYGFIDRNPETREWRILPIGRDLMKGHMTKGLRNSLERLEPGNALLLMRSLVTRGYVEADERVATALRREYLNAASKRIR